MQEGEFLLAGSRQKRSEQRKKEAAGHAGRQQAGFPRDDREPECRRYPGAKDGIGRTMQVSDLVISRFVQRYGARSRAAEHKNKFSRCPTQHITNRPIYW